MGHFKPGEYYIQSTPNNSNLQGKSRKVRVIESLKQITGNKEMDGEGMQLSNKVNEEFKFEGQK